MSLHWQWWRFPYEKSPWSQNPEQCRRWYEALERVGVEQVREQVRAALARGAGPAGSIPISTEQSVTIGFCQEWLNWHDRRKTTREERHRRRLVFWSALGVVVTMLMGVVGWYLKQ
jgi:hypothetical protein